MEDTTLPSTSESARVAKKRRLHTTCGSACNTGGSQIFHPFRALGLFTDATPFALQHVGGETFVTLSLGKTFQTYNCNSFHLLFVGPTHKRRIRAIVMYKSVTITASGPDVYFWRRARLVNVFSGHMTPVTILSNFADVLLSVSTQDSTLRIWNLRYCDPLEKGMFEEEDKPEPLLGEIKFPESFRITAVAHPNTYINKVLLGSEQGQLQLWNVKTKSLVYTFKGWGSAVTCIEQSPAVDVMGIGLANGKIYLHNLKFDQTVMSFTQAEGKVTSLSFRTDRHEKMVSATQTGRVIVWDLAEKKLQTVMKNVHDGEVISARFFPDEPIMVTSGDDNAVKMWIFDQADGGARLLRERSGHSAPPTFIRYYGSKYGNTILSAGSDRALRVFSTIQEQRGCELSQGQIRRKAKKWKVSEEHLKLSPIIQFDSSTAKAREWENIITCHETETGAHVWSTERRALGKRYLRSQTPSPIKSVAISSCGNFALLGDTAGRIDKYNIQSGLARGSYLGHTKAVQGLSTDLLNRTLVSVSLDGTVRLWDFKATKHLHTIDLESPITQMLLNKDSSLLATVTDDLVIRIFDIEQRKLVRRFEGHANAITDMAFSPDGRWLVTASSDATVRVWDLPTSELIDWFCVDKPVASLTFSPAGDFLATAHVDNRGIFLWSNQNYFSKVFFRPVGDTPAPMQLPMVRALDQSDVKEEDEDDNAADGMQVDSSKEQEEEEGEREYEPPATPLADNIITFSDVPMHKLQTIARLDLIKERNKPIQPPKKPKAAPFFLPTTVGVNPTFVVPEDEEREKEREGERALPKSRILNSKGAIVRTAFVKLLIAEDHKGAMEYLKSLSPSGVDAEFRMLHVEEDYYELKLAINFLTYLLDSTSNFDLAQVYLNLFLKIHSEVFEQSDEMVERVQKLRQLQKEGWMRLQSLLQNSLCLVTYFQKIQF